MHANPSTMYNATQPFPPLGNFPPKAQACPKHAAGIIYRRAAALTCSRCLPSQLLGASCLRCNTTWLLCIRLPRSYHAVVIRVFSRMIFLIKASFADFTYVSWQFQIQLRVSIVQGKVNPLKQRGRFCNGGFGVCYLEGILTRYLLRIQSTFLGQLETSLEVLNDSFLLFGLLPTGLVKGIHSKYGDGGHYRNSPPWKHLVLFWTCLLRLGSYQAQIFLPSR